MNIFFHTAASIGISHVAAGKTQGDLSRAKRWGIATLAFVLAFLSHGVLDGLKHLYPFGMDGIKDVPASFTLLGLWLFLIHKEWRPLFLLCFLGSILPDLLDHGPAMANHLWGTHFPHPKGKMLPWHLVEGSGSLYGGKDAAVSLTNHLIVMAFILAGVLFNARGVFRIRFQPLPIQHKPTGEFHGR